MFRRSLVVLAVTLLVTGCSPEPQRSASGGPPQIPAPPDVAAPPADALRTASGIASKVLTPGTGTRHPRPNSRVRVHYTGWTTSGETFDSSVSRGQPATFALDGVIE